MFLPPILVKLSISKPQQFSQQVHDGVKYQVEENEPEQMIGQLNQQRKKAMIQTDVKLINSV